MAERREGVKSAGVVYDPTAALPIPAKPGNFTFVQDGNNQRFKWNRDTNDLMVVAA